MRLRVFGVTLPDAAEYASFVGLRHSLWGPVVHGQVEPWSLKHWQFVEKSMRQIGEVATTSPSCP